MGRWHIPYGAWWVHMGMHTEIGEMCDFIAQLRIWKDLIAALLETGWPISHLPYTCCYL